MEFWSFLHNDEVNAVILGREFATKLEAVFQADLQESHQIRVNEWKK